MSNSERLNVAFEDLSKLLNLKFETIDGSDTIGGGTEKVVRNLETIRQYLPQKLLRSNGATLDSVEAES